MPGIATVTVQATLTGGTTGAKNLGPLQTSNTTATELTTAQTLSAGNNTVTLPTIVTPTGVVIVPPSTNTQTLTFKGVNGDTGYAISPSSPMYIPFPASPTATFVLNAGGTITDVLFWWQ